MPNRHQPLRSDRVLILSHQSTLKGPIDSFEEYLLRHVTTNVEKIAHPLDNYAADTVVSRNGVEVRRRRRVPRAAVINLVWDLVLNLGTILAYRPKTVVGANNFDTFAAILLKPIYRYRVIYFASDYSGHRFASNVMNRIYFFVERVALSQSDLIISNTDRAATERLKMGLAPERSLVIPNGVTLDQPLFKPKKIQPDQFIYIGNVTHEHGLLDIIRLLAPGIKKLVLIGAGDAWDETIQACQKLNFQLESHFRQPRDFVITYLQKFTGFGLAPYNRSAEWTYYCSPLKVNEYVACGLPVVMSEVPEVAGEVLAKKLGIVFGDLEGPKLLAAIHKFNPAGFERRAKAFYTGRSYDVLYANIPVFSD